jgi:hypothetical protein
MVVRGWLLVGNQSAVEGSLPFERSRGLIVGSPPAANLYQPGDWITVLQYGVAVASVFVCVDVPL